MYRSGVHPAVQVCVRREGEIVLDRAIGHARGNGPDDSKDTPKVAATPDTPMTVYSAAKGVTAFVAHKLVEKGFFALDDPVADYIPGYEQEQQGLDHDRPRPLPPRRRAEPAARGAQPRLHRRPRVPRQGPLRREAVRRGGKAPRLPRDLGRVHHRRGRPAGDRQVDPRGPGRGVPRSARLSLDQLRRRAGGHRRRSRSTT